VSIVSVSFLAAIPHFGHVVFIQLLLSPKALILFAEISISIGKETGNSDWFKGTDPHFLQLTMGIGHPQYLCLEISQSLSDIESYFQPIHYLLPPLKFLI